MFAAEAAPSAAACSARLPEKLHATLTSASAVTSLAWRAAASADAAPTILPAATATPVTKSAAGP